MTTLKLAGTTPASALRYLWRSNALLTLSALVFTVLFALMLALSAVDTRQVTGAPVWLKPIKFALSFALYATTIAWMLSFVSRRGWRRWAVAGIGWLMGAALLAEFGLIALQAARGVASHFNHATPFDTATFEWMGRVVMMIWLMNLATAVLLMVERLRDPALAWAMRLALGLTLVGMLMGFAMIEPTADQQALFARGVAPAVIGAHAVGVPDGGPGLPGLGWSTAGGDLRVAHFAGLHALQLLPLVGLLLARTRLGDRRRVGLVIVAALGYLGLMGLLFWQAQRGQSLVAPDALTLSAAAALGGGVTLAAGLVLGVRRGRAPRPQRARSPL